MNWFAISLLALCITSQEISSEDGVLVLTNNDFDQAFSTHKTLLVMFHSPNCVHCTRLAPIFANASKHLKEQGFDDVALASVDVSVQIELMNRYDIQGYPRVKLFSQATGLLRPIEFNGQRTVEDLVQFVVKKTRVPSTLVDRLEELSVIASEPKEPIAVYFAQGTEDKGLEVYLEVARSFNNVEFYHTFDPAAHGHYSLQGNQRVILFKNFDEQTNIFNDTITKDVLHEFVRLNSLPSILDFNFDNIQKVYSNTQAVFFLLLDENRYERTVKDIAKNYKDKLKFMIGSQSDPTGLFKRALQRFNLDPTNLPFILIEQTTGEMNKFHYRGRITKEGVQKFIEDYLAGSLKPEPKVEKQ